MSGAYCIRPKKIELLSSGRMQYAPDSRWMAFLVLSVAEVSPPAMNYSLFVFFKRIPTFSSLFST
jgi:hypothetical protein